jgi:pentatricopeptide repeat protein
MTSWLIDALVLVGRTAEAVELFDQLKSLVGKTGLMSEEFDPENNRALGNIPQAYSHVGLIRNTLTLGR